MADLNELDIKALLYESEELANELSENNEVLFFPTPNETLKFIGVINKEIEAHIGDVVSIVSDFYGACNAYLSDEYFGDNYEVAAVSYNYTLDNKKEMSCFGDFEYREVPVCMGDGNTVYTNAIVATLV